jgi:hypothetical protein
MADKKSESVETAVREVPDAYPDKEVGQDPQSNLPTLSVSKGDMPDAEPFHKEAERKAGEVFDPNAALRNKIGVGPGLQDSEAKFPAHWNDVDEQAGRDAAADKIEADAKRSQDRAKARAAAIRKGDPDPYPNG